MKRRRSPRASPGAPTQTWYCSVSLRMKRSAGRRRGDERRARRGPPGGAVALSGHVLDDLDQPVVVDAPGCCHDDVVGPVARAVVRGDGATRDGGDHVRGAEHGPAERMVAEDRFREDVVDELGRRVLDHRDLLEDDLALGVDVRERGREDHVGHDVERRLDVLVEHARVDDRVVARRGRVQLAAHPVEDLGDLERRVLARPLEEQMLEEMRQPGVARVLVARARADPDADRRRTDAGKRLGDDAAAAVEHRLDVVLHRAHRTPSSSCFLLRRAGTSARDRRRFGP